MRVSARACPLFKTRVFTHLRCGREQILRSKGPHCAMPKSPISCLAWLHAHASVMRGQLANKHVAQCMHAGMHACKNIRTLASTKRSLLYQKHYDVVIYYRRIVIHYLRRFPVNFPPGKQGVSETLPLRFATFVVLCYHRSELL